MALSPIYAGHRYGSIQAAHCLEAYLDYVEVLPYLDSEHSNKVQFIFRHQVQPWHPSSTIVHEAALAVEKVDKTKFFEFSANLFESQRDYYDESVQALNRDQINNKLAKLAESVGISSSDFLAQLHIPSTDDPSTARNVGNKITNDLKLQIKLGRQEGIHVSPTVLWDGLVDNNVSSGWTLDQWKEWLADKI
ncbi:6182_t:CDS:2 [Ambispora leptoticha]|uniref:6182_t:CDS:1 n=1 Tax=Ambispora leptoticha TaxID=144679 RepID=A0A9N9B111_9GLOM|nr:6182_t:CDS:2 [Ambispora leptoticha]